jgi:hypothetical protein
MRPTLSISGLFTTARIIVILFVLCFVALRVDAAETVGDGLRGLFLSSGSDGKPQQQVGKIAVRLVRGSTEQLVRLDHPFRSGDKIKFEVSSNRNGWLYVLHRQGKKEPTLLWPERQDDNRVSTGQTIVIPPEKFIEFDQETGAEYLYVAITEKEGVPRLTAQQVKQRPQAKTAKTTKKGSPAKNTEATIQLVQIGVRSFDQPPGSALTMATTDPGKQHPDKFLYFAALGTDNKGVSVIEFQLQHE